MERLSMRFITLLALGVILLSAAGSVVTLLQSIDAMSALGLVVAGGAVWVAVVIGLRRARSTETTYW